MSKQKFLTKEQKLISVTDTQSIIKYSNREFTDVSGYSKQELLNKPHNIVRHADMPKQAFKNLWKYIGNGYSWMGPVKNRCKNGDFYWVNAFVTPIQDECGNVKEYQSVRTAINSKISQRAEKVYKALNEGVTPYKLKIQTDVTAWVLSLLACLTLIAIYHVLLTPTLLPVLNAILLIVTGLTFYIWRVKYRSTVKQIKSTYDNPLMSYIYSGTNDDIGCINLALQMRKAELNAVIGRVNDTSVNITNSATTCNKIGHDIASALSNQKQQTVQVSKSIERLQQTITDISSVIKSSHDKSQLGIQLSAQGQENVTNTVTAMTDFSGHLLIVNESVNKLINGSKLIEKVLLEINSIAEQTNLLALNAAIEAARAGEQGRGFSVVAEEVRALAFRTQQSTEEVNEVLQKIQQESERATDALTFGNKLSSDCLNLANKTGASLSSISNEIITLDNLSQEILHSLTQQAIVADQVNENIISISEMSKRSEDSGQQSAKLNQHLLKRITQQQQLVCQFSH